MPTREPRGLFVGLATLDVVHRVDRPPGPDEKVVAHRTDVAAGGPAAVAAQTFAALGGHATLLTLAGRSATARVLTDDLADAGVAVLDRAPDGWSAAPSSAVVVAGTGERSVVSGARTDAAPAPLADADAERLVAGADVVLVDGHHPALALSVAAAAERRGVPVVLDGGSHKPAVDDLLPHVGAAIFSGTFVFPDGRRPGRSTTAIGPAFVAVTRGADPVTWWTADAEGEIAVPSRSVSDTLGAGDAFHGGFAYAVAAGVPAVEALAVGVEVAGVRVSHVGPHAWRRDGHLPEIAAAARGGA